MRNKIRRVQIFPDLGEAVILSNFSPCRELPLYKSLARQRTPFTLARVVAGNRTPGSHLATLSKLHWLPVHDHIKFKIATMTHKAIHTGNPHIWVIWFSGTRHAELYGLLLPTYFVCYSL